MLNKKAFIFVNVCILRFAEACEIYYFKPIKKSEKNTDDATGNLLWTFFHFHEAN